MPKLPDINSLDVATPAAQPAQAPYSLLRRAGETGNAMADVGREISRSAHQLGTTYLDQQKKNADDQDALNEVNARSTFLQDSIKTQSDLRADPSSYANWETNYATQAQKTISAQAATITNPLRRAQFLASAQDHAASTAASLRLEAHGQKVDADKAWVGDLADTTMQSIFAPGATQADREAGIKNIDDAITRLGVKGNGSLSPTEELNLRHSVHKLYFDTYLASLEPKEQVRALAGGAGSGLAPPPLPADISATISSAASKYGVDANDLGRTIQIESGGKNVPASPGHKAAGVAQFIPETAAAYNVNPMDVGSSIDGAARLWSDNKKQLQADLGREPTGAEVYLAHQQGAAGANALIQNPDAKATDVVDANNILANGGTPGMTAKQFVDMWTSRFNNAPQPENVIAGTPHEESGTPVIGHTGSPVDQMPPLERFQRLKAAEAASRAEDAQARAEAERARQAALVDMEGKVQDNIASIRDTGKPLYPDLTPSKLATAYTPLQVQKILRMQDRETDFYATRKAVGMASPAQEVALVDAAKPEGEGYAYQMQNRDDLIKAIAAKHAAIAADPSGYVQQEAPEIAQAMRDGFTDPSKMRDAIRQIDGAFDKLGVPAEHREVLSVEQSKALVEQLRSSPPGDIGNTINQMASQYGDAWPRVLGSMVRQGKLPGAYEVVAAVNDPVARGALVEGLADPEKVKAAVPKNDTKTIDNTIETDPDLHRLRASFAYAPGGDTKMAEIDQAVKLMAYRLSARGSVDGAVKTAIASITTGKYQFLEDGDYVARVPAGHLRDVEARAGATIDGLKASDLMPLADDMGSKLNNGQLQDIALDRAQRGHWVTNENETGLIRIGDNGKPVMLKGDPAHPRRRLEVFFGDAPREMTDVSDTAPGVGQGIGVGP